MWLSDSEKTQPFSTAIRMARLSGMVGTSRGISGKGGGRNRFNSLGQRARGVWQERRESCVFLTLSVIGIK